MPTWTAMNNLSTGDLVTEADMDALRGNIEYLLTPNALRKLDAGGPYSTTSGTFVDVDGAGAALEVTITTHGGPVLVVVSGSVYHSAAGNRIYLDVAVDGVRLGQNKGLVEVRSAINNAENNASFCVLVTGLAAGSHTFKVQWFTDTAAAYFLASAAESAAGITAIEL